MSLPEARLVIGSTTVRLIDDETLNQFSLALTAARRFINDDNPREAKKFIDICHDILSGYDV